MDNTPKHSNRFWRVVVPAIIFLFIIFSFASSRIIAHTQKKAEEKKVTQEMKKALTSYIEFAENRNDVKIDTTIKANGEYGEIERFMKESLSWMQSLQNSYIAETNACDLEKIMSPENLKEENGRRKAKEILTCIKKIIEKYKTQYNLYIEKRSQDINRLNISSQSKRNVAIAFEKGLKEGNNRGNEMWDLEAKIIDVSASIITFLDSKKDLWTFENNQFMFENNEDIETFNSYWAQIGELADKEDLIQKQKVELLKEKLKDI